MEYALLGACYSHPQVRKPRVYDVCVKVLTDEGEADDPANPSADIAVHWQSLVLYSLLSPHFSSFLFLLSSNASHHLDAIPVCDMDNSYDSDLEELKRWFGSDDDDEDDHDGEDELDGVWVSDEEDRDVENNQFVAIEGLEDYDTLEGGSSGKWPCPDAAQILPSLSKPSPTTLKCRSITALLTLPLSKMFGVMCSRCMTFAAWRVRQR